MLRTQRDGVWVPVNLTITRLHVQPHTLGLITARDIREQREAHTRLQQMDGELRRVLASVSDCLWSAEIDGRGKWTYQYISPVIEKLTGEPADFFQGSVDRWASVIHPEDRPRWKRPWRGCVPASRARRNIASSGRTAVCAGCATASWSGERGTARR